MRENAYDIHELWKSIKYLIGTYDLYIVDKAPKPWRFSGFLSRFIYFSKVACYRFLLFGRLCEIIISNIIKLVLTCV